MTDYIILRRGENEEMWIRWDGVTKAGSARAAVSAALKDEVKPDGEYAAVPARSWKPITVKVEKALKFS